LLASEGPAEEEQLGSKKFTSVSELFPEYFGKKRRRRIQNGIILSSVFFQRNKSQFVCLFFLEHEVANGQPVIGYLRTTTDKFLLGLGETEDE